MKPYEIFDSLRREGREVVLLESGGSGKEKWTFVCVVNTAVKVPVGEKGLLFMRDFLRKNKREKKPSDPPFVGGFVGFISYDFGAKWYGVGEKNSLCPDVYFVYVDTVFAKCGLGDFSEHFLGSRASLMRRASSVSRDERLKEGCAPLLRKISPNPHFAKISENLSKTEYLKKLAQIKKYLFKGETYQVNFSQSFEVPFLGDAFELYKKISVINPSPFQFFIETPRFAVISNSPERLFSIKNGIIETRPIKGTMPRGRNAREDATNICKLLHSEKEAAELAMIVDLERNDIGKICVPGTVKVTEKRTVEKYSHVIHTVANVRGKLEPNKDWLDAVYALFPGGSVTGCPKKRTIEIIRELEKEPRGLYCGSAGYIDLSGECDFNIMIRTLWLEKNKKGNMLKFRSGGGIVVDSDPEKEYAETMNKAQAVISAILSL